MGLKLGGGLIALLMLGALIGWGKVGWSRYHSEQDKLAGLVSVVAQVGGLDKLKVKDAPKAVRAIGAERDRQKKRADDAEEDARRKTKALGDQTERVIEMGRRAAEAKVQSDRLREQVKKLNAQRAGWIARASAAATRTERRACEVELAEVVAALDALYEAGF